MSGPDPSSASTIDPGAAAGAAPRRRRRWLIPLAIYLLHLGLVVYACPRQVFFGGEPVMGIDYQTHFEQTRAMSLALTRHGKTWGYDPDLLAGVPVGLVFEVDTRLHALFTHALHRLGVEQSLAFNLFVILVHLLAPLLIWLAARVLRTGWRAETVSLGLGVLLWHFDSAARWCWWAGMLSFAAVAVASPLVLALFHRDLEDPRPRYWLATALLLPLLILTHVWAFATLAVPMVALYLHRFRRLGAAGHARVWGLALFTVAANFFWLWPILQRLELLSFSGQVGQANPLYLIADYFDVFVNPLHTGSIGTRTLFRFITFAAAVLTLWHWRRPRPGWFAPAADAASPTPSRDPRYFGGVMALGWLLGLSYFASLLPVMKETEPYRFILPTFFVGAVYAGPSLARLLELGWWRKLPAAGRVVMLLLLLIAVPRVAQHIIYFIPELTPEPGGPVIAKPNLAGPKALHPGGEFQSFRHNGIPEEYRQVAAYLRETCHEQGRIVVEWWVLAEYLRWATPCAIIGGFPDRRLIHEASNIFRYKLDQRYYGKAFAEYLERYNIRFMVISNPYVALERRPDLLEPKKMIGYHRIYRARHGATYLVGGSGKVKTDLNRIEVSELSEASQTGPAGRAGVVLRFHFMDELRCQPGCQLRRVPLPDNPVGFIGVEGSGGSRLPARFVIENRYQREKP